MDWWIWALEYGPWRVELDLKRDVGGFQYLDSLSTRLIDGKVINAMGWEWEAKTPKPIMPNAARSMQLTAKSSLGKGISAKNRIWQGASLDLTTHYNPLLCLTSQRPERFSKLNWVTKWSDIIIIINIQIRRRKRYHQTDTVQDDHGGRAVADWVGLTMILVISLSARFCLGSWKFGRIDWTTEQDVGISKSKSTQPKSATSRVNL